MRSRNDGLHQVLVNDDNHSIFNSTVYEESAINLGRETMGFHMAILQ